MNLLIGTDNGLMLLDRSGQGKGKKCTLYIIQWEKVFAAVVLQKENQLDIVNVYCCINLHMNTICVNH